MSWRAFLPAATSFVFAGTQLELARVFGRSRTLGISMRASGLVEGGADGLELLAEAVSTLEGSQSPLELAITTADVRDLGGRLRTRAALSARLGSARKRPIGLLSALCR